MINENWPRWVFASITKHFAESDGIVLYSDWTTASSDLPLIVEGIPLDYKNWQNVAEIRLQGPEISEPSKDFFTLQCVVNILIQTVMSNTDLHLQMRSIGTIMSAFSDIQVYRYGTGATDDQGSLGCLHRVDIPGRDKQIVVHQFGQIASDVKLQQAAVEATYAMNLRS